MQKLIEKENEQKIELLKPKNDVVFHALFGERNKRLCEPMLSSITGEDIKIVTTDLNRFVDIDSAFQKLGIMDYRVMLIDGTNCNIEIQLAYQEDEIKRFLWYWANTYGRQLGA